MFLEIGSETGLFGLAGLLDAGCLTREDYTLHVIFPIHPFHYGRDVISASLAISFLAAIFPINTHLAIYSSFWAMIMEPPMVTGHRQHQYTWPWLAALHCATTIPPEERS